jgi:hypothetical protein
VAPSHLVEVGMEAITTMWTRINGRPGASESLQQRLASPIDTEGLADHLELEESARRAAQNNPTGSAAAQPDANEQRIAQHFRAWLARVAQEVGNAFSAAINHCDTLRELFASTRLQACEAQAAEALARHRERSRIGLREAWRREGEARRELAAFRNTHGLAREPRPATPLWQIGLAAGAAIVTEGMANAFFFAQNSDQGLLGGLYLAMVVSGINVTVALAAGVAARNLFHVRWSVKALGMLTTGLYAIFLGVYTLLCGHYRTSLVNFPDEATTQAVLHLLHAPFQIYDFFTLMLMVTSLGFAVASVAAGLLSADPVPGFSRVHDRWAARHGRTLALRTAYQGGIDSVTEPMVAAVATRLREGRAARAEFARSVATARRLVTDYGYFAQRLQVAYEDLVRRYRRIVTEVCDSPPAHFANAPAGFAEGEPVRFEIERLRQLESLAARFPEQASDLAALAAATEAAIRTLRGQARAQAEDFFAEAEGQQPAAVPPSASADEDVDPARPPRGNGADNHWDYAPGAQIH